MVSYPEVQSSNSRISSVFPHGLVAVFVGATSGIGEITLKKFAKYACQPRAYLVGRSQDAAIRIIAECKELNPKGEYIFIKADVSLIRIVDEVCKGIEEKEKVINILFLSAGEPSLDRSETSEHLHLLAAIVCYSRLRFITNLLPLIQHAPALRRVVTVAGGGNEGPIDVNDLPALRVPLLQIRGHLCTLISLSLEAVARTAPEVSFVHDYPGTVDTPLFKHRLGILGMLLRAYVYFLGRWVCVPLEECGERHLYLATSAKFSPQRSESTTVPRDDRFDMALGTTGEHGSGVYSVGWDCETPSRMVTLLSEMRKQGKVDVVWKHMKAEFRRITEQNEGS